MSYNETSHGWETLGKEARRLESEIDSKLVAYASLTSRTDTNVKNTASVGRNTHALLWPIQHLKKEQRWLRQKNKNYLWKWNNY